MFCTFIADVIAKMGSVHIRHTNLDKKKRNHPRDLRWEEHCSILWSCLITSDQRRAGSSATFALRWSCVIEHDIRCWNSVLLTANLANGSFFFVQGRGQHEFATQSSHFVDRTGWQAKLLPRNFGYRDVTHTAHIVKQPEWLTTSSRIHVRSTCKSRRLETRSNFPSEEYCTKRTPLAPSMLSFPSVCTFLCGTGFETYDKNRYQMPVFFFLLRISAAPIPYSILRQLSSVQPTHPQLRQTFLARGYDRQFLANFGFSPREPSSSKP